MIDVEHSCPECGRSNTTRLDVAGLHSSEFCACDHCEKRYLVAFSVTVTVETKSLSGEIRHGA